MAIQPRTRELLYRSDKSRYREFTNQSKTESIKRRKLKGHTFNLVIITNVSPHLNLDIWISETPNLKKSCENFEILKWKARQKILNDVLTYSKLSNFCFMRINSKYNFCIFVEMPNSGYGAELIETANK